MNQVRAIHTMKSLASKFEVDLVTTVKDEKEESLSKIAMTEINGKFFPLLSVKSNQNQIKKRISQLSEKFNNYLFATDTGYSFAKRYYSEILKIIKDGKYDIVLSHYWEISGFFTKLDNSVIKILDTHYAVEENIKLNDEGKYKGGKDFVRTRELQKSAKLEKKFIDASDIILALSNSNYETFKKIAPQKAHFMTPDGNDFEYFNSKMKTPVEPAVLFYGNMGSDQNVNAFFRFYNNIYPSLKKNISDLKIYIVGSNPTASIKALHNNKNIIVTGFVEDVRDYLNKGTFLILPMEIGAGFRGRIVEVMSMGIPVIGTDNALRSIEMISGEHGYITDSDDEMIKYSLNILQDVSLRKKLSDNCLKFVKQKYSLEATFDKFTEYLFNYIKKKESIEAVA